MNNYEALKHLNEHIAILQQRRLRFHMVVMLALIFHVLLKAGIIRWVVGKSPRRRVAVFSCVVATLGGAFLWAVFS